MVAVRLRGVELARRQETGADGPAALAIADEHPLLGAQSMDTGEPDVPVCTLEQ